MTTAPRRSSVAAEPPAEPSDDRPVVVVFFGPTGAGKSTLVNSLVGRPVSPSGILRPTTAGPVVICHPAQEAAVAGRLGCPTVSDGGEALGGLALVDTPDLDSDLIEHREVTIGLLAEADAAVYVTTALRYGDAVAHRTLLGVCGALPTLLVVNRGNRRSSGVVSDLAARMRSAGFGVGTSDIVVVAEQRLTPDGILPRPTIARIGSFLADLVRT